MTEKTEQQKDDFLTTDQMMDYYPLLTVIFDVASNVLMGTPLEADSKQQVKLELNTLYKSIMSNEIGFSDDYEDLTEEEQEKQCKVVGSYLYLGSLLNMFARKIDKAPVIENSNMIN